ncbi:MAG: hypothetical protein HY778_00250 [Betaproteobacteria bacterium]|nr:hypothetical protein [Betaproteobacteria bacterium]
MNRFMYLIYGLIVVVVSTLINVGMASDTGSRGWSSGRSGPGGGWSSGGGHK